MGLCVHTCVCAGGTGGGDRRCGHEPWVWRVEREESDPRSTGKRSRRGVGRADGTRGLNISCSFPDPTRPTHGTLTPGTPEAKGGDGLWTHYSQ